MVVYLVCDFCWGESEPTELAFAFIVFGDPYTIEEAAGRWTERPALNRGFAGTAHACDEIGCRRRLLFAWLYAALNDAAPRSRRG